MSLITASIKLIQCQKDFVVQGAQPHSTLESHIMQLHKVSTGSALDSYRSMHDS